MRALENRQQMGRTSAKFTRVGALLMTLVLFGSLSTACLNNNAAANYADQYWNTRSLPYWGSYAGNDDCANFVSASLWAGKIKEVYYQAASDANWNSDGSGWADLHTTTWAVAQNLYNFLTGYLGREGNGDPNAGTWTNEIGAWSNYSYGSDNLIPPTATVNPVFRGDVFFYVWSPQGTTNNKNYLGQINHASIVDQWSATPSSRSGSNGAVPSPATTVDAHTNYHKQEWYPLSVWSTTWRVQITIEVHFNN